MGRRTTMNSVETEGKTIDEAIAAALKLLNAGRDKVEVEVLSQASKGFLGIGGKRARIRATMRPSLEAAIAPFDPASTGTARRPPIRADLAQDRSFDREPSLSQQETGEKARKILSEVLELMGIEASVALEVGPEEVLLKIDGKEGAILIGRKGQTLDALEYLVNRIISRSEEGEAHVILDIESYRERRKKALEELALRLGERAKRRRQTVTLNPLSPRDRRVVHLTLQDDPLITTKSTGGAYFRRLLIIPEGGQKQEKKGREKPGEREDRSRREEGGGRRRRAKGS
jgi:spoIIIJ-associated protein